MLGAYRDEQRIDLETQVFPNAEELLAAYEPGHFHILFLDIYMDGMTGIDAAHQIRGMDEECALIFTTTSDSHAVEGFSLRAAHYLIKPVSYEAFCEAMERCSSRIREFARCVDIQDGRGTVRVRMRDIMYAEVFRNVCILHTTSGDIRARIAIDALEEALGGPPFLRCHRSFLVNLRRAEAISNGAFVLEGGGEALISKRLAAEARKSWRDFCARLAEHGDAF
jgi:DNA-binding LytR/AlgR family response regulator